MAWERRRCQFGQAGAARRVRREAAAEEKGTCRGSERRKLGQQQHKPFLSSGEVSGDARVWGEAGRFQARGHPFAVIIISFFRFGVLFFQCGNLKRKRRSVGTGKRRRRSKRSREGHRRHHFVVLREEKAKSSASLASSSFSSSPSTSVRE